MSSSLEQRATVDVLRDVNREVGSGWRLEGRLSGGVLGGAWLVRDGAETAVLKWHDPASSVPRNPDAAAVVAYIRAHGYPTPAWLASGTTRAGVAWSIQELVPGRSMGQLDGAGADLIVGLIEMQRKLRPPTSLSWVGFMRKLAFGRDERHERIGAVGGDAAELLSEAVALAAPYESVALPETEFVHSDLSVANILLDGGRVSGVIDIDAAGRGCAVYDVLAPALADVIWSPVGGPIDVLHEFAVDSFGAAAVAIAAATLVVERLEEFASSGSADHAGVEKCGSWLAAVGRLV